MPCGCQSACGCTLEAGAGVSILQMGSTFVISSTTTAGIVSVSADPCVPLAVTAGVLGATLIIDPANVEIALSCGLDGLSAALVLDNPSGNGGVQLGVSGSGLYADIVIDPASTAPVSVSALGLLVDCCGGAATTVSDTDSIDLTLAGNDISADLVFNDTPGINLDVFPGTGLEANLNTFTTNSVSLNVGGSGLTANVIIQDTNTIDMIIDALGLGANVRIDPASPLLITQSAAGLAVHFTGPGGWVTQVKLANETFNTIVSTDITDLGGFAPVANAVYEVEAKLIVASSATNVGVRPSLQFPAGLTSAAHVSRTADAAYNTEVFAYGGPSLQPSNNNSPAINVGFLAEVRGIIDVGPAPGVGNIRPQFAGDSVADTFVYKGSMFNWRQVA